MREIERARTDIEKGKGIGAEELKAQYSLTDNPHGVGLALQRELEGLQSARRGPYRVVYEIVEAKSEIRVLRIDHRADIYRPRS